MDSSFSISRPTVFSSTGTFDVQVKKAVRWCVDTYYQHSDLLFNLSTLTLNTAVLASKIFQSIPRIVERSANTLLSFTGVIWLNIQIRDLIKKGEDCLYAAQAKDWKGLAFSAAKVTVASLNILLTCGTFGASLVALSGLPTLALSMYLLMRPYALFSLVLEIATKVADHEIDGLLSHKMSIVLNLSNCDDKIQKIMVDFFSLLQKEKKKRIDPLALHIFRQQEHSSLEQIRTQFGPKPSQEQLKNLFLSLKKNLENNQFFTKVNFGLIAYGYVCIGICRLYPQTLIQSLSVWSVSILYTGKLLYKKYLDSKNIS